LSGPDLLSGWCYRDARTTQIKFEISRAALQYKFWDLVHSTAEIQHKLLNQVREFVLLWVVLASRRFLPLGMKISVYVAIGLESRTSRKQYNRTNISPFWEGVIFAIGVFEILKKQFLKKSLSEATVSKNAF